MPFAVKKPTAVEIAPDWLKPYCKQFLKSLVDQGYAPATMRTYEGAARLLCEEIARRGLSNGQLVGQTLSTVQAAALKAMHPSKYNQKRYCLERFIDALVGAGVAERPEQGEGADGTGSSESRVRELPSGSTRADGRYDLSLRLLPQALHGVPVR